MARIRVIVVEDDDFTRSTVVSALQIQGVDVVGQSSAVAPAMMLFKEVKPDAVVLDLDLGAGPNGIDLAFAIRRNNPKTGIVILTTFEDPRLLHSKIPNPPPGTVYLVKRKVSEIGSLFKSIEKAITNAKTLKTDSKIKQEIAPELAKVTESQLETMKLIAEGLSNSEIAKVRGVTEKSIEQTISRLAKELDFQSDRDKNLRVHISRIFFQLSGTSPAQNAK